MVLLGALVALDDEAFWRVVAHIGVNGRVLRGLGLGILGNRCGHGFWRGVGNGLRRGLGTSCRLLGLGHWLAGAVARLVTLGRCTLSRHLGGGVALGDGVWGSGWSVILPRRRGIILAVAGGSLGVGAARGGIVLGECRRCLRGPRVGLSGFMGSPAVVGTGEELAGGIDSDPHCGHDGAPAQELLEPAMLLLALLRLGGLATNGCHGCLSALPGLLGHGVFGDLGGFFLESGEDVLLKGVVGLVKFL